MIYNVTLTLVTNDYDWEVLYLNNEVISEGHKIDIFSVLSSAISNVDVNLKFEKFIGYNEIFEENDYTLLHNIIDILAVEY